MGCVLEEEKKLFSFYIINIISFLFLGEGGGRRKRRRGGESRRGRGGRGGRGGRRDKKLDKKGNDFLKKNQKGKES